VIARPFRLRRSFEFARVRRHGRSSSTRLLVLAILPNNLERNRFGFVVGKRVGKAVIRNRVRRRLREAVRTLEPRLRKGYDVVIIARGPIANPEVTFQELLETLRSLNERVGLLADKRAMKEVPQQSSQGTSP
jgi:ribonuclease P protein component